MGKKEEVGQVFVNNRLIAEHGHVPRPWLVSDARALWELYDIRAGWRGCVRWAAGGGP